jgi:hypothetical protein
MRVSQNDPGSVVNHDIWANALNTYIWLIVECFYQYLEGKSIFIQQNFPARVTACHIKGLA